MSTTGDMGLQHLLEVHSIDVVSTHYYDVIRLLVANQIEALENGISRTSKPALTQQLLSRN